MREGREEGSGRGVDFSVRKRFVGRDSDGSSNVRFWEDLTARRVVAFFIVSGTDGASMEWSMKDVGDVRRGCLTDVCADRSWCLTCFVIWYAGKLAVGTFAKVDALAFFRIDRLDEVGLITVFLSIDLGLTVLSVRGVVNEERSRSTLRSTFPLSFSTNLPIS